MADLMKKAADGLKEEEGKRARGLRAGLNCVENAEGDLRWNGNRAEPKCVGIWKRMRDIG